MTGRTLGELPLLPTAVVGSHGTTGWLYVARQGVARGEFGPTDLEELYADATKLAIDDQERAGIDVLSDGEMRRLHFVQGFYGRLRGLEPLPVAEAADLSGRRRAAAPSPEREIRAIYERLLRQRGMPLDADLSQEKPVDQLTDEGFMQRLEDQRSGALAERGAARRALEREAERLWYALRGHRDGDIIGRDEQEELRSLGLA